MPANLAKGHKYHQYKDKDKKRAVAVWKSVQGNTYKTSEITGIPDSTLRLWQGTEWWREMVEQYRGEDSVQLEEAFTEIAKKAQTELVDRLEKGDHIVIDGEIVRKPVAARDLNLIAGIATSKREELNNNKQLAKQTNTNERLLALVEQFSKFASTKKINSTIIDAEVVEETPKEENAV